MLQFAGNLWKSIEKRERGGDRWIKGASFFHQIWLHERTEPTFEASLL